MTDLDDLYAQVPAVACRGLCHTSCGPIAMTDLERDRIADRYGVTIADGETRPGTLDCPALTGLRTCRVYADRPMVCRLYGATDGLPCAHGCQPEAGRRLTARRGAELLRATVALDGQQ